MSDNRILVDWLTISFKKRGFQYVLFDMLNFPAEVQPSYKLPNMTDSIAFMGASIQWNRNTDVVVLNCSGQGCRTIETLNPGFDWFSFLYHFHDMLTTKHSDGGYNAHVSRLDLAYDIFDDERITYKFLLNYVVKRKYVCLSKKRKAYFPDMDEEVIYLGSEKGDRFLRIYNKALEQGIEDKKWLRFEMQLRNDCATSAYLNFVKYAGDIGKVYKGILRDYIRFTTKSVDSVGSTHSGRLETCRWWLELLSNVEEIKQLYLPGIEYNIGTLYRYLDHQVASTLKTVVALHHGDLSRLIEAIEKSDYNTKQKQLIAENQLLSEGVVEYEDTD